MYHRPCSLMEEPACARLAIDSSFNIQVQLQFKLPAAFRCALHSAYCGVEAHDEAFLTPILTRAGACFTFVQLLHRDGARVVESFEIVSTASEAGALFSRAVLMQPGNECCWELQVSGVGLWSGWVQGLPKFCVCFALLVLATCRS